MTVPNRKQAKDMNGQFSEDKVPLGKCHTHFFTLKLKGKWNDTEI